MALYLCNTDNSFDGVSGYRAGQYYDFASDPGSLFTAVAAAKADTLEEKQVSLQAVVDREGDYKVEQPVQFTKAIKLDGTLTQTGAVTASGGATLNGGVVINEPGADKDTRIEGDTNANLVFVDASTDRVGIGTASPATLFHVNGATTLDGATVINEQGGAVDTRIEGDTDVNLFFVDASADFVGIGTNSPSKKLDVVGTLGVSGVATFASELQTAANVGTPNNGITATEYGDGAMHTTKLVIAVTDAFTVADNAALAVGYKLYDFPAGQIVVHSSSLTDVALTAASTEIQADTPDLGLGTTLASGAQATLDLAGAGAENILTGQTVTNVNGSLTSKAVGTQLVIADGDSHSVYLNLADTWADDTGADLTVDAAGTVYIVWSYLGDPA